ncbi:metallophosphoesterase [bacterium]|nr:metallophosphoesterase [bacterium]
MKNIDKRVIAILETCPNVLICDKMKVAKRTVNLWKINPERMSEKHSIELVRKLNQSFLDIRKGGYESFLERFAEPQIRLNRVDLQINDNDNYKDVGFIGDLHDGYHTCNQKLINETIEYCVDYNIPIVLMGDLAEIGQKSSIGDSVYTQKRLIQQQIDNLFARFEPLAKKDLIIGVIRGNHEARILKTTGVDIIRIMCKMLNIEHRYLGGACWNLFKVGNESYAVYTVHGRSSSNFQWTKLAYYARLANNFDCDLLAGAHVHDLGHVRIITQRLNKDKKGIVNHTKHVITTGGFLEYDGGYPQENCMNIAQIGSPKARFYSNEHNISIHELFSGKEYRPKEWSE